MPRQILLICPRCNKKWVIPEDGGEVDCDCHLYCSSGQKPRDCSTTAVNWSGQFGWPAGAHQGAIDEGDDIRHRLRYCSTHNKYISKVPITLEADRDAFFSPDNRLPKRLTVFPER